MLQDDEMCEMITMNSRKGGFLSTKFMKRFASEKSFAVFGAFIGMIAGCLIVQRIFPRQVSFVHKDEKGNILGKR